MLTIYSRTVRGLTNQQKFAASLVASTIPLTPTTQKHFLCYYEGVPPYREATYTSGARIVHSIVLSLSQALFWRFSQIL